MGIEFSSEVNLGQIITIISLVVSAYAATIRIYHLLDKRVARLEDTLLTHASTLTMHGARMERYEASLFKVVADLQRVIGRMEAHQEERLKRFREGDNR